MMMMMTQDDDDLEEELCCLDIRDDLGAEDSDVTPTNTPPSTPPILYIKKYSTGKPNYEDHMDCGRYSKLEEYDSRTDSSLSWGDDEFEGEATRQVGLLFDQLDFLLYKEHLPLSPIPYSSECSVAGNLPGRYLVDTTVKAGNDGEDLSSDIEDLSRISDVERTTIVNKSESFYNVEQVGSSEIVYNSPRLLKSSQGFTIVATHEPTPELQEECSSWVQQFPHFRSQENNEEKEEEIIANDGDFQHLLPLVSFTSANQLKKPYSDNPRRETCSSRVCSGSNDPEVIKEQILIVLFDKLWSSVTGTIEPLLHQYAKYIIEQSVQYSSLSRESSTRGSRVGGQTPLRKVSEEVIRANFKFPRPYAVHKLSSSENNEKLETISRPVSGIKRPSSAANRLQSAHFGTDIHQEELQDLLKVSSKPLQNCEDRVKFRTLSASTSRESSAQSQISLPSLGTPRTPVHRPVSSKTYNHLLTPLRVEGPISSGEQRPASTSSYNTRTRFQEKFQHMSRHGTIQESWGDNSGLELEKETLEVPGSAWSRHTPFLPPITDSADAPHKVSSGKQIVRQNVTSRRRNSSAERPFNIVQEAQQQPQSPVTTGEDVQLSALNVRGTMLSAAYRPHAYTKPKNQVWGTPITEAGESKKLIRPQEK
ncbi:protein FAM149B1-like isoform X3 [Cherax quadricarinatus]|uniref:protein FAM149B1-like isoform X3 n=1 Tax=Cherax quadricarinatus TaxID=27406 RepID=UPI00387ED2F4